MGGGGKVSINYKLNIILINMNACLCIYKHRDTRTLTFSLHNDAQQGACRFEGTPKVVVIVDGQQVVVARINVEY